MPVAAFRLRTVRPGAAGRVQRLRVPVVGRAQELAALDGAFEDAVVARTCRLAVSDASPCGRAPKPPPRPPPPDDGYDITCARRGLMAISSGVQPQRSIRAAVPDMSAPVADVTTVVTWNPQLSEVKKAL